VPRAEPLLALRPLALYRTAIVAESAASPAQSVFEAIKPNRLGTPTELRSTTFTELIVAGGGALEYTFAGEVNWIAGANDRAAPP